MVTGNARRQPLPGRPLAVLGRPWFWCLFIGGLWGLPLLRALAAELPDPVPGYEGDPVSGSFQDELARKVNLRDLQGHLVVVAELPMVEEIARESAFESLRILRKRVRGLSPVVAFAVLVSGADAATLSQFLDEKRARKPSNAFLIDPAGAGFESLKELGGNPEAQYFLLDRHGRMRGIYTLDESSVDQLATDAGQLANWIGSDPALGEPIRR